MLLASEGRRFTPEAIKFAARLARREGGGDGGHVRVLTVARLWGTGLGLPNPGLRPSKAELAEQEENVSLAIRQLEKMGIKADGNIVVGQVLGNGPPGPKPRQMQDLSDAWTEYNPGELHPLIVLRDKDGKPLNSNPARPWMVDARIQEPVNG